MKLFVDDVRDAPDSSWTVVRKVEEAMRLLSKYKVEAISLDHDIENRPSDETYKPIAYYLGAIYESRKFEAMIVCMEEVGVQGSTEYLKNLPDFVWTPKVTVHSINPVGAKEIMAILRDNGLESHWKPYESNRPQGPK